MPHFRLFRARYCKNLRSQGGGELELPGEKLVVLDNIIYRLSLNQGEKGEELVRNVFCCGVVYYAEPVKALRLLKQVA